MPHLGFRLWTYYLALHVARETSGATKAKRTTEAGIPTVFYDVTHLYRAIISFSAQ
jgi:hypothetical protein